MKLIARVISPLAVMLPRKRTDDKRYALNLNIYRNTHFQILNQAKIIYKEEISNQLNLIPVCDKVGAKYILYPKTKRLTDIHNVCCIHEKFFMDALVESHKIPDDNYLHYVETGYSFGAVDKHNPRVEIEIYEF